MQHRQTAIFEDCMLASIGQHIYFSLLIEVVWKLCYKQWVSDGKSYRVIARLDIQTLYKYLVFAFKTIFWDQINFYIFFFFLSRAVLAFSSASVIYRVIIQVSYSLKCYFLVYTLLKNKLKNVQIKYIIF